MTKPVVVVGSGFGGLAAAARLRAMGHDVLVLEATDRHGGRASVYQKDGHTFDAGPTVMTAPHLLTELFTVLGRDPRDHVELVPVDPFYRVLFPDGSRFDYVGDEERLIEQIRQISPADVDGYRALAAYSRRVFDVGYGLVDTPFDRPSDMARVVPAMARLRSDRTVLAAVSRYIRDPRLRQAFTFQPLLVGGSPTRASSIYLLIHWLERKWGVWHVQGGTGAFVSALVKVLEECGVELRTNAPVEEIEVSGGAVTGVRLASGERVEASAVVWNGDPSYAYRHVAAEHRPTHSDARIARRNPSMSLFVAYFGSDRTYDDVAHHTILLGPRYEGLLDDIFVHRRLADDFSLYLHRPTATDRSLAPPGRDSFYVLSPVPNLRSGTDWATEAPRYFDRILGALDTGVLPGIRASMVTSFTCDPRYFEGHLRSVDGAAFGLEPTLLQSAWFRYHNRSEDIDGLWFVGQSTHPGAGIPGVLNSAKVLERMFPRPEGTSAERVLARHARTFSAAARWLPTELHQDVATVYAFCRTVDDHADEHPDPVWLSETKSALAKGLATDGAVAAFLDVARRRALPIEAAVELVRGVEGDLEPVRIADDAELLRYAWRVAGTVGALLSTLLGAPDEGRPFAIDLGIAMQLSNIARDVGEDARIGRVYLPASRLTAHGLTAEDLVAGTADPTAVAAVVAEIVALAERYYASAEAGMHWLPLRPRLAVAHASARYRAIGLAVRDRGAAAVSDRTVLGAGSRLRHLLATPLRAWQLGQRISVVHERGLHDALRALTSARAAGVAP